MASQSKPGPPGFPGKNAVGADLRAQIESEKAKSGHANDELTEECNRIEEELEALKAKYELYFLGVERLEPARRRDEIKKRILRIKNAFTRNTGLRFRIQSLNARYLSYERLWVRASREREEGTYKRDLYKARRRSPAEEKAAEKAEPPKAAAPASVPRPPAPAAAKTGLAESQMRALYDAYISAKKRCNEDTSKLSFDAVAKSVQKQIPDLMTKFKAKSVDFKVVIKDGRAILKAVPHS